MWQVVLGESVVGTYESNADASRAAEWYRRYLKKTKLEVRFIVLAEPHKGEVWAHFKGGIYVIGGLGHRAEDWKRVVVYFDPNEPDDLHTRELEEWMSPHKNGEIRFRKLANSISEYDRAIQLLNRAAFAEKFSTLGTETGR